MLFYTFQIRCGKPVVAKVVKELTDKTFPYHEKKSIFSLVNYAMPLMALAFACASCGEKGSGPGPDPDPGEGGDGDVEVPSTPSYNFQGEAYITKVLDFMPAHGQFINT